MNPNLSKKITHFSATCNRLYRQSRDTYGAKMDIYSLERFLKAQETAYPFALCEMQKGKKQSHWMWYIFPQIKGLGRSSTAKYYGIDGLKEAREYMENEYFWKNEKVLLRALKESDADRLYDALCDTSLRMHIHIVHLVEGQQLSLGCIQALINLVADTVFFLSQIRQLLSIDGMHLAMNPTLG